MSVNLQNLGSPLEFWEYFEEISRIPHCSGFEGKVREYIKDEADKFNFETKIDKAGNILVIIPPKEEKKSIVIIQSHMDMVCEKNKDVSWVTNVGGTKNIIEVAKECGSKIIYISSNAVFDGSNSPYREEDEVNPLSYYGETKVVCERLVRNSGLDNAIVRAILMYGWHNSAERQNMLTWILGSKTPLKIVSDIYSTPLLALNCAEAIWAITEKEKTGVFHIAGADCISIYDFALKIAEIFKLDKSMLTPVPSSHLTELTPRPRNTCFCTDKMEQELGVKPIGIEEGLLSCEISREVLLTV